MKNFLFFISLSMVIILSSLASAQTISIGTNQQGSLFFSIGTAISKVMVEKTGKQFRVAPYAGSSTYIPLINNGELSFGLSNGGEAAFAYSGTEIFDKKPNKNLRMVSVTVNTASGFAVPTNSEAKTVADLKGMKISSEYTSGRTFHYYSEALLYTAGLSHEDFKLVPTPNFVTAINNFAQGRVDAAIIPFNVGEGKKAMATMRGGWRYVTVEAAGERANVNKIFPSSRLEKYRPGKNATGVIADPTVMLELDFFLNCGAHVSDEIVYELVKTMYNNKPDLEKAFGAFVRFEPDGMARKNPVPYHPGAIKFYKEVGTWPPK